MSSRRNSFTLVLFPNEVVVYDEYRPRPARVHEALQLADHLLVGLQTRNSAVHHDDVTELAIERAAARELERHRCIVLELNQIPPRYRRLPDVGPFLAAVELLEVAGEQVGHELGHYVFRLAEDEVFHFGEARVAGGKQGPARDDGLAQLAASGDDLARGIDLREQWPRQKRNPPTRVARR